MKRSNRSVLLTLTAIAAGALAAVPLASAVDARDASFRTASHGFGPHRLFRLLHELDVTREQRDAIGAIMDRHRPQMREFAFGMMDAKDTLKSILTSADYDPAQVESLAAAQAASAEQMFLTTASAFAEIGSLLTAEQRAELAKLMDRRGRHRGRHHDTASF